MKKYCKGKYIEMTAEEIAEMQAEMPPVEEKPNSFEERLEAVERGFEKLEKLFSVFGGGSSVR